MSKPVNDVRRTSYNAATANPNGYVGTIDDAIAQVRAESDEVPAYWPLNISRDRFALLDYLGLIRPVQTMSGLRGPVESYVRLDPRGYEDDSVEYGAPPPSEEPGFYTLAYAQKHFPGSFHQ